MAKLRVYQLANKYEIPSKAFVDLLNQHQIPVKNHMSMLTDSQVEEIEKIKDSFKPDSKAVQKAINKQQKIEDQEKAAKEKAEAAKKEELRRKKAHDRAELAKAAREQQEAEALEAREAQRKKDEAKKAAKAEELAAKKAEQQKKTETRKKTENQLKDKDEIVPEKQTKKEESNKVKTEKKDSTNQTEPAQKVKSEEKTESQKKKAKSKKTEQQSEQTGAADQKGKTVKTEKEGNREKRNEKKGKNTAKTDDKQNSKKKKDSVKVDSNVKDDHKPQLEKGKKGAQDNVKEDTEGNGKGRRKNKKKNEHIDKNWEDQDKGRAKHSKKNKNQTQNSAQSLKVRDHSKKEKTSHASYKKQKAEIRSEKQKNQVYEITDPITVGNLAETFDVNATEIIMTLMSAGTMATINQEIDFDTAAFVAEELGYKVEKLAVEDVVSKILEEYDEEDTGNAIKRPPVVTVMGHVDHGKTSLLDRIRQSNVTAGEAGGITQHIGAYTVTINGEKITFIDTPGHEAFTAMRLRGAQMTDIAVLVVAADDGVMPQTVEAINHAKAADVPIIVAINKIDKEGANPERVKQELTEHNLVVEEWGGDVIAVPVSAKKGIGIEDLLENILLVAEVGELTADPKRAARGCVIEAQMKQGKGSTASLLVQQGTLHVGDTIISGMTYGKVRTMIDDKGRRIKKAGPSQPVEISGLSEVPVAGDDFIVLENEKEARQLAEKRQQMEKDARQAKTKVNLNDLFSRIQEGQIQDVNIIIKADVQGSVEAITQSLIKLNTDEVRINVIHGAVGAVNESDVMLASTSEAIIIGFNVRPDKKAISQAELEQVDIRLYRVIYDAIEDVKKAMEGLLSPEYIEKTTGSADVREVFRIPGGTMIAGSYVTDGKIGRNDEVRVIRDGIVVFEGKLASLRRFKDDVKEVNTGFECGIGIEKFNDIKVGDIIETFVMEAVAREL